MTEFWWSVLTGVTASLIGWLIILGLAALIAGVFILSRCGRLVRFFGVSSILNNPVLRIYMSLVYVREGGAVYADGTEASIYQGGTVVADEFLELDTLKKLFKPPALFNLIPPALLKVLNKCNMSFTRIQAVTRPCPLEAQEIEGSALILVGGPEFNSGTRFYLGRGDTYLRFLPKKAGVEISGGRGAGQKIYPQGEGMNTAIVMKKRYPDERRTVFFLAGSGANGTRAAMRYIAENWEKLYKQYKDGDFGICIQCESRRQNPQGYLSWDILRIVPE